MKVVIAPQTFKGSISALEVASAMAEGVRRVFPDANIDLVPVADGGDGTLETLVEATAGEVHTASVTGPLGSQVEAAWGALGDGRTAVVEMARTSGLALVPLEERNPLQSHHLRPRRDHLPRAGRRLPQLHRRHRRQRYQRRGGRHGPGPRRPPAGRAGKPTCRPEAPRWPAWTASTCRDWTQGPASRPSPSPATSATR